MAKGDPTKWAYFENMNLINFLQMLLFYHDKQEDIRQQRELQKRLNR